MIHMEKQRDTFKKLAHINKKHQDLSTTYVTIKEKDGTIREVTEKREMEKVIMEENRSKYHQTENSSPFMRNPLRNHFGDLGIGPATNQVLEGQYVTPPTESKQTAEYLKVCSLEGKDEIITPLARSKMEFKKSWKKNQRKNIKSTTSLWSL